jgi:hypothetical protein
MKPLTSKLVWVCAAALLWPWFCIAEQYQFAGTVTDGASNPITDALVEISTPASPPALKHTALTSTNGQYALTVTLPLGSTATVYATRTGVYLWAREIVLGTNLTISSLDFSLPTVSTTNLSLTGKITIAGNRPQDTAGVIVQASDAINGQKLVGTVLVAAAGIQATNTYRFYDLPDGQYTVMAHADSSHWTQTMVTVSIANSPLTLDFDF